MSDKKEFKKRFEEVVKDLVPDDVIHFAPNQNYRLSYLREFDELFCLSEPDDTYIFEHDGKKYLNGIFVVQYETKGVHRTHKNGAYFRVENCVSRIYYDVSMRQHDSSSGFAKGYIHKLTGENVKVQ